MYSKEDLERIYFIAQVFGVFILSVGLICICGGVGYELGAETGRPDTGVAIGIGFALVVIGVGMIEIIGNGRFTRGGKK